MNSCTAALHVALLSPGYWPREDEVITTPMTFASTASPILHTGASPVFAGHRLPHRLHRPGGNRKEDHLPDPGHCAGTLSGQVCDLDRIYEIADEHGLFVSEDAAHALWSRYKGRLIGNGLRGTGFLQLLRHQEPVHRRGRDAGHRPG